MKPVLLLGRLPPDIAAGFPGYVPVVHRPDGLAPSSAAERYASVIVVNDGDARTVRRLLSGLVRQGRGRPVPVALLTYVEATPTAANEDAVVSFEYQA